MLEWDLEGHQAFADGNEDEIVLLHGFGLHGKADPMNVLLTCRLPFPKDLIVRSNFSEVSFFGMSSFTQSSHINVKMGLARNT